jgi:hypothetical protein
MGQRSFDLILIISTTIRYHSQLHKLYSHKIILLDFQQAQRPFNSQQVPFDQLRVNHLFQSHPLRGCQPNSLRSIRTQPMMPSDVAIQSILHTLRHTETPGEHTAAWQPRGTHWKRSTTTSRSTVESTNGTSTSKPSS